MDLLAVGMISEIRRHKDGGDPNEINYGRYLGTDRHLPYSEGCHHFVLRSGNKYSPKRHRVDVKHRVAVLWSQVDEIKRRRREDEDRRWEEATKHLKKPGKEPTTEEEVKKIEGRIHQDLVYQ